jgi:hypothetical protein
MSAFGRSDSPPPSWYEPLDELADVHHDELVTRDGADSWYSLLVHDDDDL